MVFVILRRRNDDAPPGPRAYSGEIQTAGQQQTRRRPPHSTPQRTEGGLPAARRPFEQDSIAWLNLETCPGKDRFGAARVMKRQLAGIDGHTAGLCRYESAWRFDLRGGAIQRPDLTPCDPGAGELRCAGCKFSQRSIPEEHSADANRHHGRRSLRPNECGCERQNSDEQPCARNETSKPARSAIHSTPGG